MICCVVFAPCNIIEQYFPKFPKVWVTTWLLVGHKMDKENVLMPLESEAEPHVQVYLSVGNCASAPIEGRAKVYARLPE